MTNATPALRSIRRVMRTSLDRVRCPSDVRSSRPEVVWRCQRTDTTAMLEEDMFRAPGARRPLGRLAAALAQSAAVHGLVFALLLWSPVIALWLWPPAAASGAEP